MHNALDFDPDYALSDRVAGHMPVISGISGATEV